MTWLWVVIIVALVLAGTAGVAYLDRRLPGRRTSSWGQVLRRRQREVVGEDGERQPISLKMDPLNPPTTRHYTGPTGKYTCHCHGWPIEHDTDIVWWPNPETGGVYRFCQEGVKEMQEAG